MFTGSTIAGSVVGHSRDFHCAHAFCDLHFRRSSIRTCVSARATADSVIYRRPYMTMSDGFTPEFTHGISQSHMHSHSPDSLQTSNAISLKNHSLAHSFTVYCVVTKGKRRDCPGYWYSVLNIFFILSTCSTNIWSWKERRKIRGIKRQVCWKTNDVPF